MVLGYFNSQSSFMKLYKWPIIKRKKYDRENMEHRSCLKQVAAFPALTTTNKYKKVKVGKEWTLQKNL